jgi:hypothetical protein
MEEEFDLLDLQFDGLDTLDVLIDKVRPNLSKPAVYFVSASKDDGKITCSRRGKNGKNLSHKMIFVDRANGACMLGGILLGVYLSPESIDELAGKLTFEVKARPRTLLPETDTTLVAHQFPGTCASVIGVATTGQQECFFLESALKRHRINYDVNKRVHVSKKHQPHILFGLRRWKQIGNCSHSTFVVEKADLFIKHYSE